MKKFLFIFVFLFTALLPSFAIESKIVQAAMKDEMKRTKESLKIDKFDKPYFISFNIIPTTQISIGASLGALIESQKQIYTFAQSTIRVGDYSFDNSNFEDGYPSNSWYGGSGYSSIRHALWDLTDEAYKSALEQLSRKQAYKQQRNITEALPDFSKVKIVNLKEEKNTEVFDKEYFEGLAKELSAIGKKYPVLQKFVVTVNYKNEEVYYLNSEGSSYYNNPVKISIVAATNLQTKDGFLISKEFSVEKAALKDLPSKEILKQKTEDFAKKMTSFENAKKAPSFIGPALFIKGATLPFLVRHFILETENTRPYWGREKDKNASTLATSIGLRATSGFINITDNPLAKEFNGEALAGYYRVDDEGAPAQKVELVKNGKLTNLLTTRSLIKDQQESNGHARNFYTWTFPRAKPSNIFILPQQTVPEAELKNKLREECAKLELEYCFVFDTGYDIAHKIYTATGKEEPVYGVNIEISGTRPMRDILHAGDDIAVYPYFRGASASIVTPSLIVGEIEIQETQEKPKRKPLVSKP